MSEEAPPTNAGSSPYTTTLPSMTKPTSRGPRTIPATADLISRLGSQTLLDLTAAWIDSPLKEVGQLSMGLTGYPTGKDSGSCASCKAQSYTSWDVSSRSYVVSLSLPPGNAFHARVRQVPAGELPPDDPTPEEIQALSAAQQAMYRQNKLALFRGVGWKTNKQRQSEAFRAQVLRVCRVPEAAGGRARRHVGGPQQAPNNAQGQGQDQQPQAAERQAAAAQQHVVEEVVIDANPPFVLIYCNLEQSLSYHHLSMHRPYHLLHQQDLVSVLCRSIQYGTVTQSLYDLSTQQHLSHNSNLPCPYRGAPYVTQMLSV